MLIKLSSYKLVQFFKNYINPQRIEVLIEICSYMAQTWLNNLEYKYKNVFLKEHKHPDVFKNCANFLKFMEDLKPYMVRFEKNKIINLSVGSSFICLSYTYLLFVIPAFCFLYLCCLVICISTRPTFRNIELN